MIWQFSALFGGGFLHGRGCDRLEVFLKGVVVRLKLARLIDELLALRSLVDLGLCGLGFCHRSSLADLLACREVRHG